MTAFWTLIDTAGLASLDRSPRAGIASPAAVRAALRERLRGLAPVEHDGALALALLWHDDHDGAHELCQGHEGHAGCDYVHALVHRREGDSANAKYWFREVGPHPIQDALVQAADGLGLAALGEGGRWQAGRLVDACARALAGPPAGRAALMRLQAEEFRLLGEHLAAR
jgi:hypothetical protein